MSETFAARYIAALGRRECPVTELTNQVINIVEDPYLDGGETIKRVEAALRKTLEDHNEWCAVEAETQRKYWGVAAESIAAHIRKVGAARIRGGE